MNDDLQDIETGFINFIKLNKNNYDLDNFKPKKHATIKKYIVSYFHSINPTMKYNIKDDGVKKFYNFIKKHLDKIRNNINNIEDMKKLDEPLLLSEDEDEDIKLDIHFPDPNEYPPQGTDLFINDDNPYLSSICNNIVEGKIEHTALYEMAMDLKERFNFISFPCSQQLSKNNKKTLHIKFKWSELEDTPEDINLYKNCNGLQIMCSKSNIMVLDLDDVKLYKQFKDIETYTTKSPRGHHLYFLSDPTMSACGSKDKDHDFDLKTSLITASGSYHIVKKTNYKCIKEFAPVIMPEYVKTWIKENKDLTIKKPTTGNINLYQDLSAIKKLLPEEPTWYDRDVFVKHKKITMSGLKYTMSYFKKCRSNDYKPWIDMGLLLCGLEKTYDINAKELFIFFSKLSKVRSDDDIEKEYKTKIENSSRGELSIGTYIMWLRNDIYDSKNPETAEQAKDVDKLIKTIIKEGFGWKEYDYIYYFDTCLGYIDNKEHYIVKLKKKVIPTKKQQKYIIQNKFTYEFEMRKMPTKDDRFLNEMILHLKHKGKIKKYEDISFAPKVNLGSDFNLFRGFDIDKIHPTEIIDYNNTHFKILFEDVLCDGDKDSIHYFSQFIGTLFQTPYKKITWAVILFSHFQGAGKDTIVEYISKIIGESYTYFDSSGGKKVFDKKFNGLLATNLLCSIAEPQDRGIMAKNHQAIKGELTDPHRYINKKHQPEYYIRNFSRFIISTNTLSNIKIEKTDRRYMVLKITKKQPEEFFNYIYDNEITNDNVLYAIYNHFNNYDISRIPKKAPMTSCKELEIKNQSHPVLRFIAELRREKEQFINCKDLFIKYADEFCIDEKLKPVNKNRFKSILAENEIIEKRKYENNIRYRGYIIPKAEEEIVLDYNPYVNEKVEVKTTRGQPLNNRMKELLL